jgi:prepilin-type N-terminal cleavage/methylation domain-containing protein
MRHRTSRAGLTVVELLIVLTIVSILSLFASARFKTLTERSALRSARQQVESALATARASAIQKGRNSTFWISGNRIGVRTVINDAGGTTNTLAGIPLDSSLGVTIALAGGADTAVVFNPRGFATPRLTSVARYRLTKGSRTDSTCISIIGQVIGQGCVQ